MALLSWVKEWGVVSQKSQMSAVEIWRWFAQWVPFAWRTIFYATISVLVGPLTARRRLCVWAMRRWAESSLTGLAIEVEVHGQEHVPAGAFVYASNHQSLLDILALSAHLPGEFKWCAKRSLMNVPFLGWHLRVAGNVPVDRGGGRAHAAATTARFVEVLRRGFPLLLFPEGTRSEDGNVKPFKDGAFFAAVTAFVPVLPVALEGTGNLMKKGAADTGEVRGKRQVRRVRVAIGAPLVAKASGSEQERIADLRDRTFAEVTRLFVELRRLRAGGAV
jgi:1-acyl-sn-glycerol-3-phosphate acyltransferase